jgi:hypothetical protein
MIKARPVAAAAPSATSAPAPSTPRNAASIRREKLRDQFWPGSSLEIWDRKKENGFSTIPRTLGLIMTLIDELADRDKGKDVSRVYFELWCRNFDEAFIEIVDEEAMAFASGFTAPNRNVRTWKERIDVLQKLGFIYVMPVGSKKHGYILLPDPHKVIKKLQVEGRVSASWWGAYVKRASETGYVIR